MWVAFSGMDLDVLLGNTWVNNIKLLGKEKEWGHNSSLQTLEEKNNVLSI